MQDIIEELSQEQGCSLVLLLGLIELVLQALMLLHEHVVLLLFHHEVLFLLFEFLLQEVDQVIATTSELCIKCTCKHWICSTVVARFAHTSGPRREGTSHIVTSRLCIL